MSKPGRSHALYLSAVARRMSRDGVDCPSIDPKATDAELERELAGGDPAPSWTPPPRSTIEIPDLSAAFGGFSASPGAPDDPASPSPGRDASPSAAHDAHDAQGSLPW